MTDAPTSRRTRGSERPVPLVCISSNVQKSAINTSLLLEEFRDADIICVQEIYWGHIKTVASNTERDGVSYEDTIAHPNFICLGASSSSRVATYVHTKWAAACPAIRLKLLAHQDTHLISMALPSGEFNFINCYNDSRTHSAVAAILDQADRLPNLAFMVGDFNLRHAMWMKPAPNGRRQRPFAHTAAANDLIQLATTELQLRLLNDPTGPPTWMSHNPRVLPGVLDLVWVDDTLGAFDALEVLMDHRFRSDHAILRWSMPLAPTITREPTIGRNTAAATAYLQDVSDGISALPTEFETKDDVEAVGEMLQSVLDRAWASHAKTPRQCGKSKSWWDVDCAARANTLRRERKALAEARRAKRQAARDHNTAPLKGLQLEVNRLQRLCENTQRSLRKAVRRAKRMHFDSALARIQQRNVWDAVEWTQPRRARANVQLTQADGSPADSPDEIRETLQAQFTPQHPRPFDPSILDEFPTQGERDFPPFSNAELDDNLRKTNNSSTPGPDRLHWQWVKRLVRAGPHVPTFLLQFFNACIQHGVSPSVFKRSRTVVIPKPNKADYSKAKSYRPIVLLNCLGKLLEKLIASRLQFDGQRYGILHPCQYGGTMQHSTQDAGAMLVHYVREAWAAGLSVSTLLLDVAQFFPSIQHEAMTGILRRQGFNHKLCAFMEDYLQGRTTQFVFNGATLDPSDFNVGLGQGSALSPILSGLYIAPVLHKLTPLWSKHYANLHLQFFVDDGLISVASPPMAGTHTPLEHNNAILAHAFHDLTADLGRLGLQAEPDKLELMHFPKRTRPKHPTLGPDLVVRTDGQLLRVSPKATMRYLGFFLDPTLSFRAHVKHYATKATSTVAALRMLGNSARGLTPINKRTIYISNVLPLMLYGAALWWNAGWRGRKWAAGLLQTAQARAARWISGCFRTTTVGAMEMAAGLLPIRAQVDLHMHRSGLRLHSVHDKHPSRLTILPAQMALPNAFPMKTQDHLALTPLGQLAHQAESSNETMALLDDECRPGARLRDQFTDRLHVDLSPDAPPKAQRTAFKEWVHYVFTPRLTAILDEPTNRALFTDGSVTFQDRSVRAGAAWAVYDRHDIKAHGSFGVGRATPYDAEMAALARGTRAATLDVPADTKHLHIFTDNKAAVESITRCARGPGQSLSVMASKHLREFLDSDAGRQVTVHWCPGHANVPQNDAVDKAAKQATHQDQPPFTSLARARQDRREAELERWYERMADPAYRGHQNLLRLDLHERVTTKVKTHYSLKALGHSPREFARFHRFCTGHFPHGAYRQRFHLPGRQACWCGAQLETRDHILYDCPMWIHPFGRPKPRGPRNPRSALYLDDEEDEDIPLHSQPDDDAIRDFLKANPMVATFDWYDLLDKVDAEGPAEDRPRYYATLVDMHTDMRVLAWRDFVQADPERTMDDFLDYWDPEDWTRTAMEIWEPP
ncbi:hypothetical protein PsYK624_105510 [Phanerochaete sordida]|uniref:Reverse transcriptase n=1 Tax=Phanerochaete sordida TaxID=48140 RepID=A0A9P3GGB1_9APHY|nr:hypothetical protein PsYK624_105510 [Phanerochaete sordida]